MKFKRKVKAIIKLKPSEVDKLFSLLKGCQNLECDYFLRDLSIQLSECGADFTDEWEDIGSYTIRYPIPDDIPF